MSISEREEREDGRDTPPAPLPPMFPIPEELTGLEDIAAKDSFLLRGGLVDAWFIRRSDVLLVSFDNLGTVGEYAPRSRGCRAVLPRVDFLFWASWPLAVTGIATRIRLT